MAVLGKRSLVTLRGIHPDLVRLLTRLLKTRLLTSPLLMGLRTMEEQKALYSKGRTAPGEKVTNADGVKNKSNHQVKADGYGHAVDLYPYVNGSVDYNDNGDNLRVIAAHILATAKCLGVNIGWGGNWKGGWDKPHLNYCN